MSKQDYLAELIHFMNNTLSHTDYMSANDLYIEVSELTEEEFEDNSEYYFLETNIF